MLFVGYESSRGLGTECLSLGTNRLGTKDPWVRNDWIPIDTRREVVEAVSLIMLCKFLISCVHPEASWN